MVLYNGKLLRKPSDDKMLHTKMGDYQNQSSSNKTSDFQKLMNGKVYIRPYSAN